MKPPHPRKRYSELYSGLIPLHVLHHSCEGPIFGFEMIQELQRHGYSLSAGTIYPLLHGMERKGLLRSRAANDGRRVRRLYRATKAGRLALLDAKDKVRELFGELFEDAMNKSEKLSKPRKRQNVGKKLLMLFFSLLIGMVRSMSAQAAENEGKPLTVTEAMNRAVAHYPAIQASMARLNAARAGIALSKTSYLPTASLLWQSNRSTYNNITGLLLPQSVLPSLSGPVLSDTSGTTLWGSGGGALLSWQPFDFGLRAANVDVANSVAQTANFQLQLTKLDVSAAAADAFLAAVVAQSARVAAEADVNRRTTFAKAVHVLVDNQLRPGVEASRADAELAAARTQFFRAQQTDEERRIALAEALGTPDESIRIDPGSLVAKVPPAFTSAPPPLAQHPSAELAMSAVNQSRAQEHALERSYFPTFNLQSAVSGRGSGAQPNGTILQGTNGLVPDRSNFAVGLIVSFPLLDYFSLRSRKQIEAGNEDATRADYNRTLQHLSAQVRRARSALDAAQKIADNASVELQSAQMTEAQAQARYRASLANVVEVAEAQRLLVQAQTDEAIAKISVWRALLLESFAEGNLQPFLNAVEHAGDGR